MPTKSQTTLVSLIFCTCSPCMDILEWALDSVDRQTLTNLEFELIIVDNNCTLPASRKSLTHGRSQPLWIILKPRQGLGLTRCVGNVGRPYQEGIYIGREMGCSSLCSQGSDGPEAQSGVLKRLIIIR